MYYKRHGLTLRYAYKHTYTIYKILFYPFFIKLDGRIYMRKKPKPGSEGFIVQYIEIFAVIMSSFAYKHYWELLLPDINPYGWGPDIWYDGYTKYKIKSLENNTFIDNKTTELYHKMCIISSMTVRHMIANRTFNADNTHRDIKMMAFRNQEKYFLIHHNIDLYLLSVEDKKYSNRNSLTVGRIVNNNLGLVFPVIND